MPLLNCFCIYLPLYLFPRIFHLFDNFLYAVFISVVRYFLTKCKSNWQFSNYLCKIVCVSSNVIEISLCSDVRFHRDTLPGRASQIHQRIGRLGDQPAPHGCASEWNGRVPVRQTHPGQRQQLNSLQITFTKAFHICIFVSCFPKYEAICMIVASHLNRLYYSCHYCRPSTLH